MKLFLPILLILILFIWSCKGPDTSEGVSQRALIETAAAPVTDSTLLLPFEIDPRIDSLYTLLKGRRLIKGKNFFNELVVAEDLLDVAQSSDTSFAAVLIQSGDGDIVEMPGFSFETYEIVYSYLAILRSYDGRKILTEIFPLPTCYSSMGEVRYLEGGNVWLTPDHTAVSITYSRNDTHEESKSVSSEVSLYALQNRKVAKVFRYLSIVEENSEVEDQPSPYSFTKIELSDTTYNGLFNITLIETSSDGNAGSEERVESLSYYWNGREYVDL